MVENTKNTPPQKTIKGFSDLGTALSMSVERNISAQQLSTKIYEAISMTEAVIGGLSYERSSVLRKNLEVLKKEYDAHKDDLSWLADHASEITKFLDILQTQRENITTQIARDNAVVAEPKIIAPEATATESSENGRRTAEQILEIIENGDFKSLCKNKDGNARKFKDIKSDLLAVLTLLNSSDENTQFVTGKILKTLGDKIFVLTNSLKQTKDQVTKNKIKVDIENAYNTELARFQNNIKVLKVGASSQVSPSLSTVAKSEVEANYDKEEGVTDTELTTTIPETKFNSSKMILKEQADDLGYQSQEEITGLSPEEINQILHQRTIEKKKRKAEKQAEKLREKIVTEAKSERLNSGNIESLETELAEMKSQRDYFIRQRNYALTSYDNDITQKRIADKYNKEVKKLTIDIDKLEAELNPKLTFTEFIQDVNNLHKQITELTSPEGNTMEDEVGSRWLVLQQQKDDLQRLLQSFENSSDKKELSIIVDAIAIVTKEAQKNLTFMNEHGALEKDDVDPDPEIPQIYDANEKVGDSLEQMEEQVDRLLKRIHRVRKEHGFNITEAKKISNLPGFASARKNLLKLQKEIQQAQENNTALTKEDLSKIRQRIAKHLNAMRLKSVETETLLPVDSENIKKPEIDSLKLDYKEKAERFLAYLKLMNEAQIRRDEDLVSKTSNWIEASLKLYQHAQEALISAGINPRHEFSEIENQIDHWYKKLNLMGRESQRVTKINKIKNYFNEKISKSRELFSKRSREKAKRLSKVLALSLLGLAVLEQSTKKEELDMGSVGQAPITAPTFTEVPVNNEILVDTQKIPSSADLTTMANEQVGLEQTQMTPITDFESLTPIQVPDTNNRQFTVPQPPETLSQIEIKSSEQKVAGGVGLRKEGSVTVPSVENTIEAIQTESQIETEAVTPWAEMVIAPQIDSVETGTLMIRVVKGSTVSQAVKQAFEIGLFTPYLTRTFASKKEFMDAYWVFDRMINTHPELVKNIMEIDSGRTGEVYAGESIRVDAMLAVIDGRLTEADLLERYCTQVATKPSEIIPIDVAMLNADIDGTKIAKTDAVMEHPEVSEEIRAVTQMFITPEATQEYKRAYEEREGEDTWKQNFETYVRTYLPMHSNEGWLSNWFSVKKEGSAGDIYNHIVESNMIVAEFNNLRDGSARELRNYLKQHNISIADFRALQTMLYEIGMDGHVLITEDMTILDVLRGAFVFRMESLNVHQK